MGFVVAGAFTGDIIRASIVAAVAATEVLAFGTRLSVKVSPPLFDRLGMAVLGFSALKLLNDAVA